jgi:hypothetical protein
LVYSGSLPTLSHLWSSTMLRLILSLVVWFVFMSGLFHVVRSQNRTTATTDPDEARALNKIFRTWKITATKAWNISGELCSGAAIDDSVSIDNLAFNPLIKCDCSFVDSTICRIVALYVSLFSNCLPPVRRFASLEFLCLTGELVVWMLLDRFLMISGLLFTSLI